MSRSQLATPLRDAPKKLGKALDMPRPVTWRARNDTLPNMQILHRLAGNFNRHALIDLGMLRSSTVVPLGPLAHAAQLHKERIKVLHIRPRRWIA